MNAKQRKDARREAIRKRRQEPEQTSPEKIQLQDQKAERKNLATNQEQERKDFLNQTSTDLREKRFITSQKQTDTSSIREQARNRFQDEIDETKDYYDELIENNDARGAERLLSRQGQSRALRGAGGILGTPRGNAQGQRVTDSVNEETDRNRSILESQRELKLANFRRQVRTFGDSRIKDEEDAKAKGTDSYIEFLSGKEEKAKENATLLIASQIRNGVDLEDLTDDEVFDLAESTGNSVEDLSTIYQGQKAIYEEEKRVVQLSEDIKRATLQGQLDRNKGQLAKNRGQLDKNRAFRIANDPAVIKAKEERIQQILKEKEDIEQGKQTQADKIKRGARIKKEKEIGTQIDKGNIGIDEHIKKINTLLKHDALDSGVGESDYSRNKFRTDSLAFFQKNGETTKDFVSKVEQLIEIGFLEKLIEVKGRGANFGSLTGKEGSSLKVAANSIALTRVYADKESLNQEGINTSRVVGYDINELAFKAELENIIEHLEEVKEINKVEKEGLILDEEDLADIYDKEDIENSESMTEEEKDKEALRY